MANLVASGTFEIPIAATYPLERVADAFAELERAHMHSKIVVIPELTGTMAGAMGGSLEGKVIAITGASSGIGEATALLLADRGATVVLVARGVDRLEALTARIADAGGEAAYACIDVRRRGDLSAFVALACERYGKLDVLINNAGVMPVSPLDDVRVVE
jgi:NADPH:quinone reductase-like Zn-dependent oxidoreductase